MHLDPNNTFEIDKGFTFDPKCSFAEEATGAVVNLTGKSIRFRLRCGGVSLTLLSGSPPTLNGSNVTITNAALGEFTLLLTDEETALFNPDAGASYDFGLVDGTNIYKIGSGPVKVYTTNG